MEVPREFARMPHPIWVAGSTFFKRTCRRRIKRRPEQIHNRSGISQINLAGDEYYYNIALQRQSEIPRNNSYMADLEFYAEGIRYLSFFLKNILAVRKPERDDFRHGGLHVGDLRCERRAASEALGGWEKHDINQIQQRAQVADHHQN